MACRASARWALPARSVGRDSLRLARARRRALVVRGRSGANWGRGVGPLDRHRGMSISLKVPRTWAGVLAAAAVARSQRVRVAATDTGRRLCRHRLQSRGATSSRSRSADGRVLAKTIRITDPALLPGKVYMSVISPRRRRHVAGRGPTYRQRDGLSVVVARFGRGPAGRSDLSVPSATATRGCVARRISRRASVRRLGRDGWRLFRQGSVRASACASPWGAARASCWLSAPGRGRPCTLAAFAEFRSGDIFNYVVPRGCRR